MNSFIKYPNKRWRPKPQLSYIARQALRHPYTGSKRFDRSCRNHGACGYCSEGRQHAKARHTPIAEWELVGFEGEVLDEWNTYADPWDWGTIFDMSCDKEDELAYNERLLEVYDSYYEDVRLADDCGEDRDGWYCDPWDMWDPHEIEDRYINGLTCPEEDYRNYTNYIDWEDPNSWRWEFNGLEEDHIMSIIDNRLNTLEVFQCHISEL